MMEAAPKENNLPKEVEILHHQSIQEEITIISDIIE